MPLFPKDKSRIAPTIPTAHLSFQQSKFDINIHLSAFGKQRLDCETARAESVSDTDFRLQADVFRLRGV